MAISESEEDAKAVIKNIYDKVKELKKLFESDFIYLSAMKSPVSRIKNKYRYQILARVKDDEGKVTDGIYDIVDGCRKKNVTSYLEVNPSSMY
jgi:primosomal protein N'